MLGGGLIHGSCAFARGVRHTAQVGGYPTLSSLYDDPDALASLLPNDRMRMLARSMQEVGGPLSQSPVSLTAAAGWAGQMCVAVVLTRRCVKMMTDVQFEGLAWYGSTGLRCCGISASVQQRSKTASGHSRCCYLPWPC